MGEVACAGTVEYMVIHFESLEEFRQDDASHTVDSIHTDAELAALDGVEISKLQLKHAVNMTQVKREVFTILSQLVDFSIVEIFAGCDVEYFSSISCGQEFALAIEQFQGIPLTGIM